MIEPSSAHLSQRSLRRMAAFSLALASVLAGALGGVAGAQDVESGSVRAGDVEIVAFGTSQPLREGGTATEFGLQMPEGAACQGDTADDGYLVYTFLAPVGTDPATIAFTGAFPDGDRVWPLFATTTESVTQLATNDSQLPNTPGQILAFPPFDFKVFREIEPPDGVYRVGVACTFETRPTRFWDTEISLATVSNGPPLELQWTAVGSSEPPAGSSTSRLWIPVTAAAAAVLLICSIFIYSRRTRAPSTSFKEQ